MARSGVQKPVERVRQAGPTKINVKQPEALREEGREIMLRKLLQIGSAGLHVVVAAFRFLLLFSSSATRFACFLITKPTLRSQQDYLAAAAAGMLSVCAPMHVCVIYIHTHTHTNRDRLNHAICQVIVGFGAE